MKKMLLALAILATAMPATAQVRVKGYVRSDGTYVAPHVRSRPDSSIYNNYSTRPNVNPYTGQTGTRNPYSSSFGSSSSSSSFGVSSRPFGSTDDDEPN